MARATFGDTVADFLFTSTTANLARLIAGNITFWSAKTGGTQYTDLLLNAVPVTSIPTGDDGLVPTFSGPDSIYEMWADGGGAQRVLMQTNVIGGANNATTAGYVSAAGATYDAVGARLPSFNVKHYGAVGNGSTDDTAAINACLTAAAASATLGAKVIFPGCAVGYKTTSTITIPDGLDVDMAEAIIYSGSAGTTCLVVGSATRQTHRTHRLRVRRVSLSTWLDEADLGVKILNMNYSRINIAEARNFTIGAQTMGDGLGYVYNTHVLGEFRDNKIGIDVSNDNAGWNNENHFIGGSWTHASGTYTSIDRVGIRFSSVDSDYYNNSNHFDKPSFEIKGGNPAIAAEGLCVLATYGSNNLITNARHESPDTVSLRQLNDSTLNRMYFAFNTTGQVPTVDNAGTFASASVYPLTDFKVRDGMRLVYKAEAIHKTACYYDGATLVNVPGLTAGTSSTANTDARALSLYVMNASYLEIPNSRMLGFYMSTRVMKSFVLECDDEVSFGGRHGIRCYDTGGSIVTTTGAVRSTATAPVYATSFGGAFRTGSDSNNSRYYEVSAAVDYVFVFVCGGTAAARLRSFAAYTAEASAGAVWLAQPDYGFNYGTAAPSAGTWAIAREVRQAVPTVGQPKSWVCTVAGTPGTWVSTGNL